MATEETPPMSSSDVLKTATRSIIEVVIVGGLGILVFFGIAAVLISALGWPFGVIAGILFILPGIVTVVLLVVRIAVISRAALAMPRSPKK